MTKWNDIQDGDQLDGVRVKLNTSGGQAGRSTTTGLLSGGVMTINAGDNTLFDISAGTGLVVDDYTDSTNPDVTEVSWDAQVGVATSGIGSAPLTRIAIDASGVIVQKTTVFTPNDYKESIVIGSLLHPDFATNTDVTSSGYMPTGNSMLIEFVRVFGAINISGNIMSANGANLDIDKSSGSTWKIGGNLINSAESPNVTADDPQTAPSFFQVWDDGTGSDLDFALASSIDPTVYDDGSGTLATVSNPTSQATARYIYYFPESGLLTVRVGDVVWGSLEEAVASATAAIPFVGGDFNTEGSLRCILCVEKGCTDLSGAEAVFSAVQAIRV